MTKGKILVVDDEKVLTDTLYKILSGWQFETATCNKGENFLTHLAQFHPDLVLMDVYLGNANGMQLLQMMTSEGWKTPVIMMTAYADVPLAVEGMKLGAVDFLVKPIDLNHLSILIEKTLNHVRLQTKVMVLQQELEDQRSRTNIVSKSKKMQEVLEIAAKFARSGNTTVLIEGESGTGKELVARYIIQSSARADFPFIRLNCGAIPKDLAESEFFGYEKGAFTGATEKMKEGKFELANRGTILLDEIGELSLDMQVKLLRVLEEQRFYRLGGTKEITIDARIITATNRDLLKEVGAGRFREDLYYRLNVATIKIPPLRERKEDIALITQSFMEEYCGKFNKSIPRLAPETVRMLEEQPWKGNVRELRNAIERVLLLHEAETLFPNHFSFLDTTKASSRHALHSMAGGYERYTLDIPVEGTSMNQVVKDLILKTLTITKGNQVQAAKILGLSRSKLRYRMEQLGIEPQRHFTVPELK